MRRRKVWVNFHESDPVGDEVYRKRFEAVGADGTHHEEPVAFVELRRGEVIVDVEALIAEFRRSGWLQQSDVLRAALRKVGVRCRAGRAQGEGR